MKKTLNHKLTLMVVMMFVFTLITPFALKPSADEVTAGSKIEIVTFNDFHGTLKEEGKNPGAAKLVGEIKRIKSENPNTIIVSGGDLYQGSALSNLLYGEPVTKMLLEMGLTASAIGNHEFDWGESRIAQWSAAGNFDFLASNIYLKGTETPYPSAKPYIIKEVMGKRIAFIGLATPETAYKTSPENVVNLEFRDPSVSAKYWAKYLKDNHSVDAVIALTHLGGFQNSETNEITGEVVDLANNVSEVDAIISAHTHQKISGVVNGKPIVQTPYNGRALAKLTLTFSSEGKLDSITPSVDDLSKKVATLTEDPAMKAIIDKYIADLAPILDKEVATNEIELPHDRDAGLSVLGAYTTELMAKVTGAQIAITNGGGIRTSIDKGTITVGEMYTIMPFDNTLVTMKLKGSDLKRVIEHGIMPDGFGWGQFYGLKVYYDKDAAAGQRITSMRLLDGTLVEMDKYYTIVTNDFVYAKGDKYDFSGATDVVDTTKPIRDEIIAKLQTMSAVELRSLEANASKVSEILVAGKDPVVEVITTPDDNTAPNTPDDQEETLPQTGSTVDPTVLYSAAFILIAAGAVLVLQDKKKKKASA